MYTVRPVNALPGSLGHHQTQGDSKQSIAQTTERRWSPMLCLVTLGKTAELSLKIAPILSD